MQPKLSEATRKWTHVFQVWRLKKNLMYVFIEHGDVLHKDTDKYTLYVKDKKNKIKKN